MESTGIQQITHRRNQLVITHLLDGEYEADCSNMAHQILLVLHENNIIADSVTLALNENTMLLIVIDREKISGKLTEELVQLGCDISSDYSLLRIKGTGIRGVSGLAAKILDEFSRRKINIEILLSGTTEYDFFVKKRIFDRAFSSILRTLDLPGIRFS